MHEELSEPQDSSRICTVVGCTSLRHPYINGVKDDLCVSITATDPSGNENWYIAGYRDEVSGVWAAYSDQPDLDELEGAGGLLQIERFAVAYRIVHDHCEALNETRLTAEKSE